MESRASANEVTPLLADPPIDDDVYHYEQRIFPSPLQKQLLLGKFTLSFFVSRLFELSTAVWIIKVFGTSFVPATIYSVMVTVSASPLWFLAGKFLQNKSRKAAIAYGLVGERVTAMAICTLLLVDPQNHFWLKYFVSILLIVLQRSCDSIQVHVIEHDWAQVLANNESVPYTALTKLFRQIKGFSWVCAPVLATWIAQYLGVYYMLKVFRVLAFLTMIVEYSLVRNLYSTCYALRVPNLMNETSGKITFSRPSIERICFYIRKRPRPVLISIGATLANSTLLTIRTQQLLYLDQHGIALVYVGIMAAVMPSKIPMPYIVAVGLNLLSSVIAVWALYTSQALIFGLACVASKLSIYPIETKAQSYVNGLISDPQLLMLFSLIETRMTQIWGITILVLPALWVHVDKFIWPVSISVVSSLIGLLSMEFGFRWGPAPSAADASD